MNNYFYRHPDPINNYYNVPQCHCMNMYHHAYNNVNHGINHAQQDWRYPSPHHHNQQGKKDNGREPYVVNIKQAARQNNTFRTAIWTGKHLQVTLMSIQPGEDVGLERHQDTDQFLRIEQGQGLVQMGKNKNSLNYEKRVSDDSAIMVPAGMWHNITNTGRTPLKLYSIYAPPEHKFGIVHKTKAEAIAAETNHR